MTEHLYDINVGDRFITQHRSLATVIGVHRRNAWVLTDRYETVSLDAVAMWERAK